MTNQKPIKAPSFLRPTPVHRATVIRAGAIAIGVNLLLFIFKISISLISGSLAILSDALHGLVDTLSGIIVIISEKIQPTHSGKAAAGTNSHAISHQDIERIGSRIIAVIILLVAAELIFEAIKNLISPTEITISTPILIILAVAMLTKIALGLYLGRTSRQVGSSTLKASSTETLNDSIISAAVLFSSLAYLWWHIDIEAPISIIVALFIAKSGLDLLKNC